MAAPFILNHPSITVEADSATPIQLECSANEVHTNVDQDESTTETFCGSYTSYKAPVWDVTIQGVQSFGTDGLWTVLHPLCGTVTAFELIPDGDQPVSVDNPIMSGTALVKEIPFIDAAVGEASEFDVVLAVQGLPTFGIVAPASASSATATTGTATTATSRTDSELVDA